MVAAAAAAVGWIAVVREAVEQRLCCTQGNKLEAGLG